MVESVKKERKSAKQKAEAKIDVRRELVELEKMIATLKTEYEQHFLGYSPYSPDKLHRDVRMKIRRLIKAPFKTSQMNYNLRALEGRFNTYNSYWLRTQRQREEGTYSRDLFKANMRERHQKEDVESRTQKGKANNSMQSLFDSYKNALEKNSGAKQNVDYGAFKKSLIQRAKDFQKKNGNKKLTFKVVMSGGKVTVQAKAKV